MADEGMNVYHMRGSGLQQVKDGGDLRDPHHLAYPPKVRLYGISDLGHFVYKVVDPHSLTPSQGGVAGFFIRYSQCGPNQMNMAELGFFMKLVNTNPEVNKLREHWRKILSSVDRLTELYRTSPWYSNNRKWYERGVREAEEQAVESKPESVKTVTGRLSSSRPAETGDGSVSALDSIVAAVFDLKVAAERNRGRVLVKSHDSVRVTFNNSGDATSFLATEVLRRVTSANYVCRNGLVTTLNHEVNVKGATVDIQIRVGGQPRTAIEKAQQFAEAYGASPQKIKEMMAGVVPHVHHEITIADSPKARDRYNKMVDGLHRVLGPNGGTVQWSDGDHTTQTLRWAELHELRIKGTLSSSAQGTVRFEFRDDPDRPLPPEYRLSIALVAWANDRQDSLEAVTRSVERLTKIPP